MRRRLVMSLSAATLLLVGGVVAGSPVGGTAERPETVPSTEAVVETTEAPPATEAPATTDAPAAPATTEAAVATTEAAVATTEGAVATTEGAVETTEAEGASTEGHPLVGAWMLTDLSDPEGLPFLAAFTSDGVYHQADSEGAGYGAWEATGPNSAAVTFVVLFFDDEGGEAGSITIRATVEVDPDGLNFTAEYTVELAGEGFPEGEFGPGSVTGTRIVVEPMGTPVGALEDLFAAFPEDTEVAPPTTTTS